MASKSLEFTGANVDEATAKGLKELGLNNNQVEIEVLDSGSKGILGIGGRPARIQLTVKEESVTAETCQPQESVSEPASFQSMDAEAQNEGTPESTLVNEKNMAIAGNVVRELLEKMRIKASVEESIGSAVDDADAKVIRIDINGDDLSYLIGRHSETLNALQYITSLIVGRELGHWVPLIIDVQGYRERRERQLRQMATRMADQVTKSGRRIALEPMPSTERRIIHLILRDNKDVITESVGDEPNRKVVIIPRQS